MATPIRIKRSAVAGKKPTTSDLQLGELAVNFNDGKGWKIPSGESTTFVGWNPMCIPTMDYIVWKLKRREKIAKGEIK